MQITDLYQTKITCSTYNANIDSTDTVITVKLIDFNGNAVTNKSVTLTCDKGYFNKKGSTSISGTTTKSITLTTNSSGEITGTWTASEWGLCTFSTNTVKAQVNIKGYKLVETIISNNLTIKTYTDGIRVVYSVTGSTTINTGVLTNKVSYHPVADITIPININNDGHGAHLRIASDGGMQYNRSGSSSDAVTSQSSATTFLATPLY